VGVMRWGLGLLGLGAVAVVAIGAIGFGGVAAQTPPEEDKGNRFERYRELLAGELGITVEELTEAQTNARNQLIDEAVAEGKITQEQADSLKELEPGEGLGFGLGLHRLGHKLHGGLTDVLEVAAEAVNLPVEDVRERLAGGESLSDIAASQNIDEETLTNDLVAALTDRINQAVADGDLDQEQADRLIEHLDELVDRAIDLELPLGELRFGERDGGRFFDRFFR
jgi:polyhydroxyalkanoate synthesis regulator phasin